MMSDPTHARDFTMSTSHTEGSAAVLLCRGKRLIGVDLVLVSRVTQRHAEKILTRDDWSALDVAPARLRPALGWALKEATAKATGAAQHYFPTGICIVPGAADGLLRAQCMGAVCALFDSAWLVLGGMLCLAVVARDVEDHPLADTRQVDGECLPGMNSDLDENMFAVMTCGVNTDAERCSDLRIARTFSQQ